MGEGQQILMVLGMHRSGTSYVSQWLSARGVHMGDTLLGADFSNKQGHFEDYDFIHLHKEILRANEWNETGLIIGGSLEISHYYKQKIIHLCALKRSLRNQWGWKEPRTCLFIEHYSRLLPEAKFLVVHRDPVKVIDSLIRRDIHNIRLRLEESGSLGKAKYRLLKKRWIRKHYEMKGNQYLNAYVRYNKNILDHLSSCKEEDYLVVNFDAFSARTESIAQRLEGWGFTLEIPEGGVIYDPTMKSGKLSRVFEFDPDMMAMALKTRQDLMLKER